MATGFEDLGAVEEPNAQPHGFEDLGAVVETASPKPTSSPAAQDDVAAFADLGAVTPQVRARQLVADPDFNPAAYAHETGDEDTAFEARELRRNRSFGEKAGEFGKTLLEPQTYVNAARSAAAFAGGLVATPLHAIAQAGATAGAPIARAVGADDLANTLENEQQTQGSEALQSAQQIEESLRSLGRGARGLVSGDERARFRDEIAAYRNQLALGEQRPLDTGVVAAASRALTGNDPSAAFSPEALAAHGARPASPLMIELGAASGDPTNLMIPVAGKVLPKAIAGGVTQAAGKVLQAPERAIGYIPKVARMKKIGGTIAGGVAAYEAIQHPEQAAQIAGLVALGKTLGWLGKGLDAQGLAYRTGAPSPLDIAKAAGRGTMSGNAQRLIGNTAVNAALGVAALEPVDYLQAEGDPRLMAEALIGNAGMGAMFGLPGETFANRQQMQAIQAYRFAQHGAQQLSQNAAYPAHNAVMATMKPEYRDQINRLRAYLHAGTGTDVLVLDGRSYADQVGRIGQNTRGNFAAADGVIYLNADSISADPLQTGRHEAGHAIVNFLQNAGRDGEASGLFDAIKAGMTPEQLTTLTSTYRGALSKGTKVKAEQSGLGWEKGEDAAARANFDAAIAEANPEEKILEENLSEIVRDILDGRGVESFSLPKPILERLTDSVAGWMERRGWLNPIDTKAELGFKAQAVKEAARQAKALLYETGQRASQAMADGPTAEQEMIRIQREIDAVPPFNPQGNAQTEQANAQQRQRLQRELSQWERRGAGIPVPADAAAPAAEGQQAAAPAPPDAMDAAAEQLRSEGNTRPYPFVKQAMQRNPAATTAEQIVDTVRKLAEEREAIKGAIDDLTKQKIMTRSEANKAIEIAITQHEEPITNRDNLVTAAIRVNAKGSIAKGEFNRPSTPEARIGAGFSGPEDAAGVRQRFTIVGTAQRPPQAGDHVQIYAPKGQPDIYRVAKVDKDGMLLVVGTLTADEKTTFPVKPGTFTLLETTSAPQAPAATPPSPAQESKPPNPAPVSAQAATPAPAAGEPSPQPQETPSGTPQGAPAAIPGLDAAPGAGTPEPPAPKPKGAPIPLAKGPGGVDNILNIIAKMGGFAAKKNTQEWDDMSKRLAGYPIMGGTETPEDVSRNLFRQNVIPKDDVGIMWQAIDAAIVARKSNRLQETQENARQRQAKREYEAQMAKLSPDLQEKITRPGGAELTPDEIAQVKAVFPDFEYQPPEPDAEPSPEPVSEPPTGEPVPPRTGVTTAEPPVPDGAPRPGEISHAGYQEIAALARKEYLKDKPLARGKQTHRVEDQKEADKRAFKAAAEAHAATVPANYEGIKLTESPLGEPEVSGTIRPGRAFDDYLLGIAGTTPEQLQTILDVQNRIGDTISLEYAHAAGRPGEPNYRMTRRVAQKNDPAKGRIQRGNAQTETKVFLPQKMKFNFGTKTITTLGTNSEKLLANFGWAAEAMEAAGETMPYRSVSDPKLVADLKGLQANHDAGYTWDGQPITGIADRPLATNRPSGEGAPYQGFMDEDGMPDLQRFEFLNLLLGNEGARIGKRGETAIQKAKMTLGIQNRGDVSDPVTAEGETNQLRDRLNEALGPQELLDADGKPTGKTDRWSATFLEDPLNEALLVDNIERINPTVERGESPLHESGYAGDLDRHLGKLKTVNTEQERIAAAGRFMPEEDTSPQGRAKKRIESRRLDRIRKDFSRWNFNYGRHWKAQTMEEAAEFLGHSEEQMAALNAYMSGGFTEMSQNPDHPVTQALVKLLKRMPSVQVPEIHRALGFMTPEDRDAYLQKIGAEGATAKQERAITSWTTHDPRKPGLKPHQNIALEMAEGGGEHTVILTVKNPTNAKDISFGYSPDTLGGMTGTNEVLLPPGTKLKVESIRRQGDQVHVEMAPSRAQETGFFMPEDAENARDIVPAIRINGTLTKGKRGDTHQDILNRHMDANPDDVDALMNFDSKANPNLFVGPDGQEISREQLKERFGVRDSQGLKRIQEGQSFMPEDEPQTPQARARARQRESVKQHTVKVAMREIEQDMKDGTIPDTAASFAELQDHTDANLYVNDADREDRRIGPLGKSLGWKTQDFADFTNEVIAEIDKRLSTRQRFMPEDEPSVASLRDEFKRTSLISTGTARKILGDKPDYLDAVADFMGKQRQKTVNGALTKRDVAKAYLLTLGSIGAGGINPETFTAKTGMKIPKRYLSIEAGNRRIRPEEAVALWMGTPNGKAALDAIDAGNATPEHLDGLLKMRDAFGRNDIRNNALRVGGNQRTLANIAEVTAEINAAKGDVDKIGAALQSLTGIAGGKIGFIKHLLGLGDTSTVDAVELNFWLTGKGSIRQQEGKRQELVRNLKEFGLKNPAINKLVTNRIGAQVTRLAKQYDLDPAVASHIMHHWLWDAAKDAQTTHKGMMEAQARFMPDESAPQPPERPARGAKLPDVMAYGRERRAWIDRFVAWSEKQPRNKPIVLADGDDRTGVITPAIGGGYRITRYLDIDGEQVPHGHMEFQTREEAVRDALTSDGFKGASDRRFMPESSPEAPRQRPDPRSAARARMAARTQQERPEREMATAN